MEITKENCKDHIKNMKEIKYFNYSIKLKKIKE